VDSPYFDKGDELVTLYEKFIRDFETRINQLKLIKIVLRIARQITDLEAAYAFLQKVSSRLNQQSEKEAYALSLAQLSFFRLQQGQLDDCKRLVDQTQQILDGIAGADPFVYSRFYYVVSSLHKIKVSPSEFYRSSLMYLVYTPIEQIPLPQQQALAIDLGVAALISTDIYNFGELLAHPILDSLTNSSQAWLRAFLFAFNSGDINQFNTLINAHKNEIEAQPGLKSNLQLLKDKISILAFMELVFNKTSDERTIDFKTISQHTQVSLDQVELLVMKTLSLKLMKGVIDELAQNVSISWVQPRVLDLKQVEKMRDRLSKWVQDVDQVLVFMQNETAPELLS